jgi:uncharacterized repeat protein (TIGR01451 family)
VGHERPTGWMVRVVRLGAMFAGATLVAGACNGSRPEPGGPLEDVGEARSASFVNGGFETGTPGQVPPAPWVLTDYLNPNPNGITIQTPETLAGLNLTPKGMACTTSANCFTAEYGTCVGGFCSPSSKTVILNGANQPDATLGTGASIRWPRYGAQCALVNQLGDLSNVNALSQTMTVVAADVDPADGLVHIRFVVAPVLEDPAAHTANQQPYFYIQATNVTRANAVLYSNFNYSNQPGVTWQTINVTVAGVTTPYTYTDWQLIDIAPVAGGTPINVGDSVQLDLIAAGCSIGGHVGQLYVDGLAAVLPGINVEGTGPAQVNPGANITYTFTYKNGSAAAASGVAFTFTVPPGTTFQSITPPAGATCTPTLAVGAVNPASTTCTFAGSVPAGGSGTITAVVQAGAATTGQVVCGSYNIASTQEPEALIGPKITSNIGCTTDAACPAGDWCNETLAFCVPTEANGVAIPVDGPHTNPTLNGTCTAAAGALVCTSGVCDPADNECGLKNGDGACTVANGPTVCRSGVCDTDGKCGLADGDGTCTVATGPVVCRSGVCSVSGVCEAAGTCDVDADCTGGDWCFETTHTCTPQLANGAPVPTDPPHTTPVLNGTCSDSVAKLVCLSGVCDPSDNKCGFKNGDGTCTAGNGPVICRSGACDPNDHHCGLANGDGTCTPATGSVVCRSGMCSVSLVCEPAGGCEVDADCAAGNWCMESTNTCTPKLGNGVAIPTDPPHTGPTLNGMCTAGAAALVCVSGVCDPSNNECGIATGNGTCTVPTGPVVCQSGACSVDGTCEPAGGCEIDADCAAGSWCLESTHTCTPKLANGTPVPTDPPHTNPVLNGMCTAGSGALVCVSGVCDPKDNECGLANGDGTCTVANGPVVCRSGVCSNSGVCLPMGSCNVDTDCSGGNWCNETAHMCTPKLANGTPVPSDPPHTGPTLNGMCTAGAGALVCVSGVCDPTDNKCGIANSDAPCTVATGPVVCRSGACSINGTCEPAGGCNVDADCTAPNWCEESMHMCMPQLANGTPVPTDPPHTGPTLNGMCTAGAGALVCQSGVCDPTDNKCGLANGDGTCTMANGGTVCRSGACDTTGVCIPPGGCAVDSDCPLGKWCDESMGACLPDLANGTVIPTDPPHTNPTLNGMCTTGAATLVCASGVCDTHDNECGYANGDGPCTATDGDSVCRSTICVTTGTNMGLCEACVMDSQCPATAPHCTASNTCVQCTSASQCSGSTPICDTGSSTCVACNGDQGSGATDACPAGSPFCFLSGSMMGTCGMCATNADCQGHTGNVCDTTTGLCVTGCFVDTDCSTGNWCNAVTPAVGMCVPKLANGTMLPSTPSTVSVCTAAVGTRVCLSGVCDPKDNTCGLAAGDGPCQNAGQCRNDTCNPTTMTCSAPGCTSDSDCSAADFCNSSGACTPKLPLGGACTGNDQCQGAYCQGGVCSAIIGSGNGLLCAARESGDSGSGGAGILGLMLAAAAGLSRRSRRRGARPEAR